MEKSLNNRRNWGFWIRFLGTLFTLALLVMLLSRQGWGDILAAVRQIPLWRFVIAILLIFISRLAVTGRWYVLLRSAGVEISFYETLRLTFSGLFASNFLPTTIGGDVIRLIGALQLKYDAPISAASLVVDRLIGMMGMATVLPVGIYQLVISGPLAFSVFSNDSRTFVFASLTSPGRWVNRIKSKTHELWHKLLHAFTEWLSHPKDLFKALGFTWLHMACLFLSIMALLQGMGEAISFWQIAGLWSLVYFITLIPISINGLGLQEVSMALIYTNLGGISYSSSLTIALLIRTLAMFASLPGAIFVPGILEARARLNEKLVDDIPIITPD